jgi:hypothetical protein
MTAGSKTVLKSTELGNSAADLSVLPGSSKCAAEQVVDRECVLFAALRSEWIPHLTNWKRATWCKHYEGALSLPRQGTEKMD